MQQTVGIASLGQMRGRFGGVGGGRSKLLSLTPIVRVYGISHLHFYVSEAAAREWDVGVSTLTGGQEGEMCSVHADSPGVI